ncbi:hypothetical protein SADUNF_Sadunf11G0070900 [Salix dunnii]|uniref:Uncharacterized protein n=1 Tax=Salix dunnii TaxID=1413687 RepID=A0A835MX16_9ROSI|nr:hypothetical protein SADUNF_Sadunf11G0070900 [Salix dunnii]
MDATPSPRRRSPSAPGSLAGAPRTVAGNGSSPARNASPLAGKRVIDNGNTSGHVPQHARQLCQGPGDGGRRRVPRRPEIGSSITATHRATCPDTPGDFVGLRRPEIGSRPGRKSGLRYREPARNDPKFCGKPHKNMMDFNGLISCRKLCVIMANEGLARRRGMQGPRAGGAGRPGSREGLARRGGMQGPIAPGRGAVSTLF